MIKKWLVTCQCDYTREIRLSTIVKANTARKAKIKAEKYWEKQGHKCIWIEDCKEWNPYEIMFPQTLIDEALKTFMEGMTK